MKISKHISPLSKDIHKSIITFLLVASIIAILTYLNSSIYVYILLTTCISSLYWFWYVGIQPTDHEVIQTKTEFKNNIKSKRILTFEKIHDYIIIEKKYLSPNINSKKIANEFKISCGYLSQLINTYTQKSFNDFINGLRIRDAKIMLLNMEYDHYTIESIGLECGFKSKSNFYVTFKKFTGQTPNQFKKSI